MVIYNGRLGWEGVALQAADPDSIERLQKGCTLYV